MENKDQNTNFGHTAGDVEQTPLSIPVAEEKSFDPEALSYDVVAVEQPIIPPADDHGPQGFWESLPTWSRFAALVLIILSLGGGVIIASWDRPDVGKKPITNLADDYATTQVPLGGFVLPPEDAVGQATAVTINGTLIANGGVLIVPSLQPADPEPGQLYFDEEAGTLGYFNGTDFVMLDGSTGVENVGGLVGQVSLGQGLSAAGGQLSNTGVLSVQGQRGAVTFSAGSGITINGTTISNSGVLSVSPGSPAVTVTDDGNGNLTIDMTGSGSGTVSSVGGTAGRIAKFTGVQAIADSLLSEAGSTITVNGDLVVTGDATFGSPLTVANGGTGRTTLTANGVLVGAGAGAVNSVAAGGAGLCLVSTAGAPSWASCTNGSNAVQSLNGLTGAITIANATGLVNTITIDDASTSNKGIAQFNNTNFSVSGGNVNTIQNISTGSSPTFNGLTLSGNLTVQGGTSTLGTVSQAGSLVVHDGTSNTVTIVAANLTGDRIYTLPDAGGNATLCVTSGNCIGGSGSAPNGADYLVANLNGTLTNERALSGGNNITLTDGGANANLTVATVQNPTFTSSVTTPQLQSSGALTISSAGGASIAVDAGTTIELQDSTNVTGSLDVSVALNVGTANAFAVNSSGVITAAAGITSSGTIIFSALDCTGNANGGALTTNGSGQLVCSDDDSSAGGGISGSGSSGTIPVFNGATSITNSIITQSGTTISIAGDLTLTTDLTVSNGGTGASSFTSNGVLYGNGSGALNVTAAGTGGQVLVANAGGVPTFVSFSSDVTVAATGAVTIQPNAVALGTDTTGNYVATLGGLTGLNTSGNSGEGSTPTLSVIYGSAANTAVQGNVTLTCPSGTGNLTGGGTSITLGTGGACADLNTVNDPTFSTSVTTATVILTGAGNDGEIVVDSLGQGTVYTLPDPGQATADICLSVGNCTASGTAGGDLTGTYPNPTIAKLQGVDLDITSPIGGHILIYNATNTAWENHAVSSDIAITEAGVATIQSNAVALGADTTGNYVIGLSAGNGVNVTGTPGEGWTPTVAVIYGSSSNTAVQGNTSISVTAGTNLTGGGSITLGSGGTVTLNVASSPIFSGTLTVQGGTATVGTTSQQGVLVLHDGAGETGTIQTETPLGQSVIYTLPDPGVATAEICLDSGNCTTSGSAGGDLTGTYPNPTIAKLQGGTLNINTPTAGHVLIYNGSNTAWENHAVSSDINISETGVATIQANAVALGTDTTGNYVATLGGLTGLSTTGNSGEGSTPTLSVLYGSSSNTAVQGNTSITVSAGTNLTGGGSITLGSGGTVTLNVSNSPTFSGTLTVQGASVTVGTTSQLGSLILHDGAGETGTIEVETPLGQSVTYTLPDPGGPSADICLSSGNCSTAGAAGGDLTGTYPNPTIAKLQGVDLDINTPTAGHVLIYNGSNTAWENHAVSSDINISETGVATVQSNAVALGADTTGNYVATLGSLTGLSTTGNTGEGSTPTLSVLYGSSSNTAVQGNTSITVSAGTNLTGGGSITLGSGGTVTLNVSNSPTFSGTLTVQGASVTVGTTSQLGSVILHDGAGETGTIEVETPLGQSVVYTLPDPGGATAEICLDTGNCAGTGSGVTTAGGTTDFLAKFTGSQDIGDSIVSDDGSTVTITGTGNFVVQGGTSTLGTTTQAGTLSVSDGSSNTISIVAAAVSADRTFTLPETGGPATFCMSTGNCVGGGGGSAPSDAEYLVLSLHGSLSNERSIANGSNIAFTDAGANNTLTVATVQNPTFTTSVTTPTLQSSGALTISSGSGTVAINATTTIELQDNTNVTGILDVSASLNVGTGNAFVVSSGGAITAATGITSSGTITFSSLDCTGNANGGVLTADASGVVSCDDDDGGGSITGSGTTGTISLFTGSTAIGDSIITETGGNTINIAGTLTLNNDLTVANGGTGASSFTTNGVLYGNNTGAIQVTAAGTGGQVLVANAGGVPTFVSFSSDINVAANGAVTIQSNAVALTTDTTGDYVANLGTLTGLSTAGNSGEGSTPSLSVLYGSSSNTAVQGNTSITVSAGTNLTGGGSITLGSGGTVTLNVANAPTFSGATVTIGGALQSGSLVLNDGDGETGTISVADLTSNTTFTLPDSGDAEICVDTGNCTAAGSAGGDLTGTYPNPTIASLQGTTLDIDTPLAGHVLIYNGSNTAWENHPISSDIAISETGVATIQSNAVALGADTTGNYVATIGSLTGLSTTGNTGEGSTPTLSVLYGSSSNTAVQGNTSITVTAGTNLTGGGSITLGSGGTVTLNVSNAPTFSGATVTIGGAVQSGSLVLNDGDGETGTISVADLTANTIFTLPDSGDAEICVDTGNCTAVGAAGGDLTGTYPNPTIASLQGTTLDIDTPTAGHILIYNGSNTAWENHAVSSDIAISETGVATIQSNAVALGADTTGNYVATIGSLTGLSTTGNTGEGSTPTLSVLYGSSSNTAVQGNTTLTCPSGTGNLTGGGTSITLGTGGTCANLNTVNNPTFSTSVTTPNLTLTGAGSNGSLVVDNLGQATTYTLPDPAGPAAEICLDSGNCTAAGSAGGDLTGTYPNPTIAKLQGVDLDINTPTAGHVLIYNGSNTAWENHAVSSDIAISETGVATIQSNAVALGADTTGNYVATLGSLTGLSTTGNTGEGSTPTLSVTYGSGANTAVQGNTALNCPSGTGNLSGGGTAITLGSGGTCGNISITNSPTFTGTLTVNTIDATGAMTIGNTGQSLTLQGNATTTLTAEDSGNTTTVGFATPVADITINFPALASGGPYTVCTSQGNCGGVGATLQTAYTNSTGGSTAEIVLDGTRNGLTVRDSSGGIGMDLFEVQNNAGSTSFFAVDVNGIETTGTMVSSGNINTTGGTIQTGGTDRISLGGNLVNIGTITTSGAINSQTISSAANFTGTVTIQGANALTLGVTGTSTGAVLFKGATAASGTITLVGQANPTGSRTITLPDESGTVCTSAATSPSNCTNFAPATGSTVYATRALDNLASVDINAALGFKSNQTATINFNGAATTTGNLLSITGQTAGATGNDGGAITIQGGTGTTTGAGGTLSLLGGAPAGASGTNGSVTIDTGNVAGATAGTIAIGTSNFAHNINIGNTGATGTQAIAIGGNGNTANTIDIDAGTGATGIEIGNTNTAHGIQIGTNATGDNDISIGGTNSGSTIALESGTAASAIQIGNGATAHGIQIGSNATGDNDILLGGANSGSTITLEAGTAGSAIQIGNGATAHGIQIGTGAAVQTIIMGSTNSTSALTLQAGTGNLNIGNDTVAKTTTINIGADNTGADVIALGSTNASSTLTLESGTGASALLIGNGATAHGIQIGTNATGDNDISLGGTNAGSTVTIEAGTAGSAIQIGNGATAHGIQIGTGAAVQTIVIGSTNSTSPLTLQAGTGNLNIGNDTVAKTTTINIGADNTGADVIALGSTNASSTLTLEGGTAGTAIQIGNGATAHGIQIGTNATGDNDIIIGGTNSGSTVTIQGGTAATAIQVGNNAAASGIQIGNNSSGDKDIIIGSTNASSTLLFESGTAATAIQIGNGATAHGIQVGTNATGDNDISIGGTNAGSTITLESGTAATAIQVGNGATAHGIQIGSNATADNDILLGGANSASSVTIEAGTAAAAIQIGNGATAHGIQIGTNATGDNDVVIGGTNAGSTVTLQAGTAATAIALSPAAGGDVTFSQGAGSQLVLSASAATTVDQLSITNSGQASTTNGVDGISLIFGSSNASGDALHITPTYAGGANDTLTYNVIEMDAFSPTNGAGTDTINGIKIGALTEGVDATRLTSAAINIGAGWDSAINVNGTLLSLTELGVLDAGIELGDLTTQGTATDEFCLTSETGGGALLEWQTCGAASIVQVPATTLQNTITPTANSVVGLTVNATSGTATQALIVNQSQAADAVNINVTNASGAVGNGLLIAKTGGAGTITNGLAFSGTIGTDIQRASGVLSINGASGITLKAGSSTIATVNTTDITLATGMDLILAGANAYITNPQGSTTSEVFGNGATVASGTNRSIVIGNTATLGAVDDSVVIGYGATASNDGVAIGSSPGGPATTCSSNACVAIGADGATAGLGSVALGYKATASNGSAIALGANATTTATNQFVVGSDSDPVTQVVFGSGVSDTSGLSSVVLQATSAITTSNLAGASFTVAGGQSTGSATGGSVIIQGSAAGGAGAGVNSLATLATFAPSATGITLGSTSVNTAVTLQSGSSNINLNTAGTGDVVVTQAAGSNLQVTANAAPTLDQVIISNSGQASTTANVDALSLIFGSSNASGDALHITPSYAGGATDALTYNIFEADAFSPTNGAGTDTVNGIKLGNLTDPGATITSNAINIGSGWDSVLSVNGSTVINGSGVVQATAGGTGQSSYTVGDMLYASTTTAISKLAAVATGQCLISQGTSTAPAWGSCTLQTAYTNSTGGGTPEIKLDSTRGVLNINDADTSIGANSAPTVTSVTTSSSDTSNGTHNVTMPATVADEDLLVVLITVDGNNPAVTDPDGSNGGWYDDWVAVDSLGDATVSGAVWVKYADGTEDGTTVNFSTAGNGRFAAQVYRIPAGQWYWWGGDMSKVIKATHGAQAATTNPDPPSLNPSTWDIENTLWIAYTAGSTYTAISSAPAGYSGNTHVNSTTTTSAGASASSASRSNAAASEDPGTFTVTAPSASNNIPFTIAVRPAPEDAALMTISSGANSGTSPLFSVRTYGGTPFIGIGTNAPNAALHIMLDDNAYEDGLTIQNTNTGSSVQSAIRLIVASVSDYSVYTSNSGDFGIWNNVTDVRSLRIAVTSGNVEIGDQGSSAALLVLDYGTSDPTGVNGGMYYNSSMVMMRCYADSYWRPCNKPAGLQYGYDFREDFNGAWFTNAPIGETTWDGIGVLGTAILGVSATDADHMGIIELSTNTGGAGTNVSIYKGAGGTREPIIVGSYMEVAMAVKLSNLSDVTDEYDVRFGLCDVSNGDCVDGVYFEYDRNTSTNWSLVTANNSTRTRIQNSNAACTGGSGASVAVGTSWTRLRFVTNSAASQVDFYVGDTFVGCITTNIPTARTTSPMFHIVKSGAGTNARLVDIDYFEMSRYSGTKR